MRGPEREDRGQEIVVEAARNMRAVRDRPELGGASGLAAFVAGNRRFIAVERCLEVARLAVDDAEFASLREHFDEATMIELTQLVGFYTGVAMLVGPAIGFGRGLKSPSKAESAWTPPVCASIAITERSGVKT